MSSGYLYCFSNPSLPGIYKIGMTARTPEERLKEANSDTWRHDATPFIIEFTKCVENPRQKEKMIHKNITSDSFTWFNNCICTETYSKIK